MKVRKMKRLRILILALCVCLIAGVAETLNMVDAYGEDHNDSHCICGVSDCTKQGTEAEGHTADNTAKWTAWNGTDAIDYGTDNTAYVYLTQDVEGKYAGVNVNQGKTLYLCLNGHKIKRMSNNSTNNGIINISDSSNGGTLILCDCQNTGVITHDKNSENNTYNGAGVFVHGSSCKFIMYGGTISGNNGLNGTNGGGVYVTNGGTFEMRGGTISGNAVTGAGGGVYAVSGSKLQIYGGTINGNIAGTDGGGISITSCSFSVYGGIISDNTASGNGGGLDLANDNFTLNGGEIKNNSANNGGGVYMYSYNGSHTLTVSGSAKIIENTVDNSENATGGGVFLNSGNVAVSGGANISGNVKGGTISNGSLSDGKANNVYLPNGKTINITGQLTGINPIGVTTENTLAANGCVRIAQARVAEWAVPGKFTYENDSTGIFTKTGYTTYLVACKHNYNTSWLSDDSYHWHKCSNCDEIETKTAHDYNQEIASESYLKTAATCTDKAVYYKSCVCGKTGTETFEYGEKDANNHTGTLLGEWHKDDNNHWKVYSCCSKEEEKAGHTWVAGEVTKEASCAEKGSQKYACSVCGKEKIEELSATGHIYTAEIKSDDTLKTRGTCVAEAVYYYSCTNCGEVEKDDSHTFTGEKDADNHTGTLGDWQIDDNNHWRVYSCCSARANEAAHTWDGGTITKEASCTGAGSKVFTCGICKKEKTEVLNATGHDLVHHDAQAATCTEIGWDAYDTCLRCDYTTYNEIPATGHMYKSEWNSNSEKHWHECAVCKDKKDEADHTWGVGVITTPATTTKEGVKTFTCEICKATKTEAIAKILSGGGVTPPKTDTITVDVTGDKTSVKITAEISGDTASIAEIGRNDIDKAGAGVDITIDLTVLPNEIAEVTVTKNSLENIYDSETDNVSIKLTETTVNMDRATLKNIIEQMNGSDLKLVVDKHQDALESMNKAQKDTLKGMKNPKLIDAYFISGGIRITDFKGGSVEIKVPYSDKKRVRAWYIDDNGKKEKVPVKYDGKTAVLTISHFSHYVIEEDSGNNVKPAHVKKTSDKVIYVRSIKYSKKTGTKITFNKVSGADGYYVYGNRCNTDKVYKFKMLATLKGNDNTVFVHKKAAKNTFYKYYIKAYRLVDGRRVTVSRSEEIHFVTDVKEYKYGNPTKVALSSKKCTLNKGKTFNLKNRVKVYSSKKVLLHTDKVRYVSSDSRVAKVNSRGRITAEKAGRCNIYAIAQNGRAAKITVTVK